MHENKKKLGKDIYADALLLNAVLTGAYSEEQAERLFEERPDLKAAYEQMLSEGKMDETFGNYDKYSPDKAYRNFEARIRRRALPKRVRLVAWWRQAAAVVVLAVAGLAGYYFYGSRPAAPEVEKLIAPGEEKALLSFEEGKQVDMNARTAVDTVIDQVKISYRNGVLSYRPLHGYVHTPSVSASFTLKLNKLSTPLGAENRVILSDGTLVRLNAGSKLVYPIAFHSDRRVVYLEGEGYFDVTKDAERPFEVQTKFGSIRVLGTSFNVNAYSDGDACRTTLVEGSVQCTTASGQVETLEPGEQLAMNAQGETEKRKVDVDEYVGWTRGLYVFKNRTLKEIMNTFEKWYNVKVTYANPQIATWRYSGSVKRNESINAFLHALELTDEITFKIRERDIEIYEN